MISKMARKNRIIVDKRKSVDKAKFSVNFSNSIHSKIRNVLKNDKSTIKTSGLRENLMLGKYDNVRSTVCMCVRIHVYGIN